jgi:hypothetical protein
MNHGPAFQALWNQLRKEVVALQSRGYYGDGKDEETPSFKVDHSFLLGMWSSGTRLEDSTVIAGHETLDNDLPEYMVRTSSRLYVFRALTFSRKVWRGAEPCSSFSPKTTPAASRWPFHVEQVLRPPSDAKQVLALRLPGLSRAAAKLSMPTRTRRQRAPDSGKKLSGASV